MQAWNLTNAQGANKNEVGYEKTWFDYPEQLHGKVLAPQTYIRNRDLSGWKILNGGERVGALQLSVSGTNTFGRLETPELSSLTESTNLKLELDLARFSGASKNRIAIRVEGGGSFSRGEVTVDGKSKKATKLMSVLLLFPTALWTSLFPTLFSTFPVQFQRQKSSSTPLWTPMRKGTMPMRRVVSSLN